MAPVLFFIIGASSIKGFRGNVGDSYFSFYWTPVIVTTFLKKIAGFTFKAAKNNCIYFT